MTPQALEDIRVLIGDIGACNVQEAAQILRTMAGTVVPLEEIQAMFPPKSPQKIIMRSISILPRNWNN